MGDLPEGKRCVERIRARGGPLPEIRADKADGEIFLEVCRCEVVEFFIADCLRDSASRHHDPGADKVEVVAAVVAVELVNGSVCICNSERVVPGDIVRYDSGR